jgi:DNA-binding MarR family transcriptional regulator
MKDREIALYGVFAEVRSCFHRLKALAEELHGDTGVTPAMRAVLETLAASGSQTVPEIARLKGVSRQHIQIIVNALLEVAFVETQSNPTHRRSQIIALTEKGASTFQALTRREAAPLRKLASTFEVKELRHARAVLSSINERLKSEEKKGDTDDTD